MKSFIVNMRKEKRGKLLFGLTIARGSPTIFHLLFADNSFFFCKSNREELEVILKILKYYEEASRHKSNFQNLLYNLDTRLRKLYGWKCKIY